MSCKTEEINLTTGIQYTTSSPGDKFCWYCLHPSLMFVDLKVISISLVSLLMVGCKMRKMYTRQDVLRGTIVCLKAVQASTV